MDEAKRFGLTCGVKAQTIVQKTCDSDPDLCGAAQLCKKASMLSGGKKVWRSAYSSRRYVNSAKEVGLSCGIKAKVDPPKIDKTYKVASGTGFFVSSAGHIITNNHVIDGCNNIRTQSLDVNLDAKLVATDPKIDLALLKIKNNSTSYFPINDTDIYEDQEVIVAGYPFGDRISSTIKITRGVISSLAGIGDDYSQFQIDAAVQPGNSGGPVVDEYGNMIGVAVSKLSYKKILEDYDVVPENTNFAIKASSVQNLMTGNSIKITAPNWKTITRRARTKGIKEATVHLTCWMTKAQLEKVRKSDKK